MENELLKNTEQINIIIKENKYQNSNICDILEKVVKHDNKLLNIN